MTRSSNHFQAMVFAAIVAAALDTFVIFSLLNTAAVLMILGIGCLHLLLSILFGLVIARLDGEAGAGILGALYLAVMGPLGALLTMLTPIFRRREGKRPSRATAVRQAVIEEARPQASDNLAFKILTGRAYDPSRSEVEPFKPILSRGSTSKRQDVLATIARDFRPSMLPLLANSLRSNDVGTRTTAATVVRALVDRGLVEQETLTTSLATYGGEGS
ncbi:MAG: hypothetical protein AAGH43_07215 [Pseudomonadota bacterium]